MKLLFLSLIISISVLTSIASARIWTAFDGRMIEAELITYSRINHDVTLKRSDGLIFRVPTKILSWKDIDYLENLGKSKFIYSKSKAFDPFDNYWDTQEYINYKNWERAQACKSKPSRQTKRSIKRKSRAIISTEGFTININL